MSLQGMRLRKNLPSERPPTKAEVARAQWEIDKAVADGWVAVDERLDVWDVKAMGATCFGDLNDDGGVVKVAGRLRRHGGYV